MNLTSVLQQGAKEKSNCMEGKKYSYIIYRGIFTPKKVREGVCEVKGVRYNISSDCDVYTIKDVDTNKCYSVGQFNIKLKEI